MVRNIFAVACLFMATISSCVALSYTVGDAAGWGLGVDFSSWSAGKIFNVGDDLGFKYVAGHTVAEVSSQDYTSCTVGNSISTHKSGDTIISLKTPGTHYFICTVPGHCAAGMKLAVPVSAPGGSVTTTPPGTIPPPGTNIPPTPPAGGLIVPQMTYNDASATPLSYGTLALMLLLLGITQ